MDISIVIPTKDRPGDLRECLDSILGQSVFPAEVVVIDDGRLDDAFIGEFRERLAGVGIGMTYERKDVPGLSMSRNLGVARSSAPVVLFLDDDIVLDRPYVEILKKNWEMHGHDPRLGGIGGLIKNQRRATKLERLFHKVFLLSSPMKWDVTDVGYQVWDSDIRELTRVQYLPGGISSFRKSLLEEIRFEQRSPGRTPADEVEVYLKAKKAGYYFLLDPAATLLHKESEVAREHEFSRGVKEGFNQVLIFQDLVEKSIASRLKFGWSSTGWALRQFLAGHLVRFLGMLAGYAKGCFR